MDGHQCPVGQDCGAPPPAAATTPLHPKALEFHSPVHNVTVLAVQGTNPLRLRDIFQDMLLFHRAFTYELTAQVSHLFYCVCIR